MQLYTKLTLYFLLACQTRATWLENIPQKLVQSSGQVVNLFATGDQYFHRLHDHNDYTVVLNPEDGDFYYARKRNDNIIPSEFKVGRVNPLSTNLEPGLKISREKYLEKKEYYEQNMSSRNGRDAPTSGNLAQLNIFIRFADDGNFPNAREYYDIPFNSSTEPSIKDYFYEVSYGALTVDTYHFPPSIFGANTSYTDSRNRGYYSPYSASNTEGYQTEEERAIREHTLLRDAVVAIQNSVPEDLNIDSNNDGYVDALSFSVYGNVDGWSELLWPHRWALYSFDVYINGARVYDYTFELTESSYFTAGVLCHEFFHVLGAPDLYHYNDTGAPDAVGGWDIMESTSNPPQYMGAFLKWKYGDWIPEITEISSTGTYTLNPLQEQNNVAYKIASPNSDTEYFVLEYRVKQGVYDSNTPGSRDGLLVYRINSEAGNGNAQGPPDEIYLYRPGGTLSSQGSFVLAPYNTEYLHTELNDFTDPEPFLYNNGDGFPGGLNLLNVGQGAETITFTISIGAPTIEIDQEFVSFEMAPNDFQSKNITLSNGGALETLLMFDLQSVSLPFIDPNGGPDGGGYYWISSENDNNLDYNWIDIENVGTPVQFPNNDSSPDAVQIGFSFPFFDRQYNECLINPNGWIGFEQDNSAWSNVEIPNNDAPRPAIFGMWDDLNPVNSDGNSSATGNVYHYSDTENQIFVIWYNDVVTWQGNTVSGQFDFQIVLHSDGRFEINYNEINGSSSSATIGFQNESGNDGTLISFNEEFINRQQSIFVSKASSSDWLMVGTQTGEMSGLIQGGQSFNINIMANTNGMEVGSYFSDLVISSDQVDPVTIPIQLEVQGESAGITIPYISIDDSETGIVELPNSVDGMISSVFQKYTHLQLPEDIIIPILAQDEFSDQQILHVKKILKEYLKDVPSTTWGNKTAIINTLSMSNAFLMLLNDEGQYQNPGLQILFQNGAAGQDVLSTEVFPEGTSHYMNSSKRDATFEEVLHFVHNYGIENSSPGMQAAIDLAMNTAISNEYYFPSPDVSNEEHDDEYLALLMEVYFGFWAHDPENNGFAGDNEYRFINREEMLIGDILGSNIINQFLGDKWRYTPTLPESFSGLFSLSFDSSLAYTNRSQYLQNIILSGDNNVNIYGNDFNNRVFGNAGDNTFYGLGADDYFYGGGGIDRFSFIGERGQYTILDAADWNDHIMSVVDIVADRDGIDTLIQVEEMEFNGEIYIIGEELSTVINDLNPNNFKLFPTHPNPFNSSTTISYNIPKISPVKIFVVDILGRKIKTLVDNVVDAGLHQVKWRGNNDFGILLPSGIYYIQFISNEHIFQIKTLMIK